MLCLKGKGWKNTVPECILLLVFIFLGSKVSDCNDEKATVLIMTHHRCCGDDGFFYFQTDEMRRFVFIIRRGFWLSNTRLFFFG